MAPRTLRSQMMKTMSKLLHVSRKTLHKHTKFRVQIDEYDVQLLVGLLCVGNPTNIGFKKESRRRWQSSDVIPSWKHVLRQHLSRGVYVEQCKYDLKMIEVALFEEFQEINPSLKIAIRMFDKLKPWFIRYNTIHVNFCCQYHVEF